MNGVLRPTARRFGGPWRRGAGIAVLVVVLAILNMAVLGAVAASGDESAVGALRLETSRAFYAAESGAIVALRLTLAGESLPTAGSTLTFTHATLEYEAVPDAGQPGDIVIIGSSGTARRRVKVTLEEP